ncbi:hypothetical protein E2542_SST00076 [Spatholobus suberectus]|nr:hypothetical protein E2542_SST00076 [Spatholobus suberectus]
MNAKGFKDKEICKDNKGNKEKEEEVMEEASSFNDRRKALRREAHGRVVVGLRMDKSIFDKDLFWELL